jgi:rubredoxin
MIEAVVHRLKCDNCGAAWISPVADTPTQARHVASLNGWTSVNDLDRCPRCTRHKAST